MTKAQFEARVKQVDDALGNPQMKWEGPEPHDFRNMKERGVRFVHSPLFARHEEDGTVRFKILVGDDAAAEDIGSRLVAAGLTFAQHKGSNFDILAFEDPTGLTP